MCHVMLSKTVTLYDLYDWLIDWYLGYSRILFEAKQMQQKKDQKMKEAAEKKLKRELCRHLNVMCI